MNYKTNRKILSILIVAILIIVAIPFEAIAANTTNAPVEVEINEQTYSELGFTLTEPEDFDPDDGVNPHGTDKVIKLKTLSELGIYYNNKEGAQAKRGLYDYKKNDNFQYTAQNYYPNTNERVVFTSVAIADPDSDKAGVRDITVQLNFTHDKENKSVGMTLRAYEKFTNANTKEFKLGNPFRFWNSTFPGHADTSFDKIPAYGIEGLFQMVSGDFDGDGMDEIALYFPSYSPRVEIWKPELVEYIDDTPVVDFVKVKTFKLNEFSGSNDGTMVKTNALKEIPLVSLSVGDFDKDNIDDLVITASYNHNTWSGTDYASKTYIFDQDVFTHFKDSPEITLTSSDFAPFYNSHVFANSIDNYMIEFESETPAAANYVMLQVGSDFGDVDGDTYDELVIAGLVAKRNGSKISSQDFLAGGSAYMLTYINYNPDSYGDETQSKYVLSNSPTIVATIPNSRLEFKKGQDVLSLITVVCAQLKPIDPETIKTDPVVKKTIFVEGMLYDQKQGYIKDSYPRSQISNFTPYLDSFVNCKDGGAGISNECISQAIAMNFNGNEDGREQIAYVYTKRNAIGEVHQDFGIYGGDPFTRYTEKYLKEGDDWSQISLWLPDVNDDSVRMKYVDKDYSFTDPIVMAILVSPPYFDDLAGIDDYGFQTNSSTAWEETVYVGTEVSVGGSVSAGIFAGFETDVSPMGIYDVLGVDVECEIGFTTTMEARTSASVSSSIGYNTFGGTDSVAVSVSPVIDYRYKLWVPDTLVPVGEKMTVEGITYIAGETIPGHWEDILISIPKSPVQAVIDVDKYDEVAEKTAGLNKIRGNILFHEPGDPSTYKSQTKIGPLGESIAIFDQVLKQGDWIWTTNSGNNSTSRSLEVEASAALSIETSVYSNAKLGGKLLGIKGGLTSSLSAFAGVSAILGTTLTYSGEVVNMPAEAANYQFQWKLFSWTAKMNGRLVPVIDYLVQNTSEVPHIARDLRVIDVTTDSSTIEWDVKGYYPLYGFEVQRYNPDFDVWNKVARVTHGNTYTDRGLDPSTEYTYRLISIGEVGDSNKSLPSETVTCNTLYDGPLPIITQQPEDITAYSGDNATFSIVAQENAEGRTGLMYQWQQRINGQWVAISNEVRSNLTLSDLTTAADGSHYRCAVGQMIDGTRRWIYSELTRLTVINGTSSVALTTSPNGDYLEKNTPLTITAEVSKGTSNANLTGYVTFNIMDADNIAQVYAQSEPVVNGKASITWSPKWPLHYQIVASYGGNSYFDSSSSEKYDLYVYDNIHTYCTAEISDKLVYGEETIPKFYNISSSGKKELTIASITSADNNILQVSGNKVIGAGVGSANVVITDGQETFTQPIEVVKRPLDITVADRIISLNQQLPDDWDITFSLDTIDNKSFPIEASCVADTTKIGSNPIVLAAKTPVDNYPEFRNYDISLNDGTLYVLSTDHQITYNSPVNGSLAVAERLISGNSANIVSGSKITAGSEIVFTAKPTSGYRVKSWTVNNKPVDESDLTQDRTVYTIDSLSEDVDVVVEFEAAQWTVTYSVDGGNGTITAATRSNQNVSSPVVVAGLEWIEFTASPDSSYMVENWYIDDIAQNHYDNTFKVDSINGNLDITVKYTAAEKKQITTTKSGLGDGTVEIYVDDILVGTDFAKVDINKRVEIRANPNNASIFEKWVIANNDVQGNDPIYVIEKISGDLAIEAAFDQGTSYNINYVLINGDNGDVITAIREPNIQLDSGSNVIAMAKIQFDVAHGINKKIEKWIVNNEELPNYKGLSYTIDSLSEGYDIEVYLEDVDTFKVEIEQPANGTITAYVDDVSISDGDYVQAGKEVRFTYSASGYAVQDWLINSNSQNKATSSFRINITEDIKASVDIKESSSNSTGGGGGGVAETVASFTVKFDTDDGSLVSSQTIAKDATAKNPANPTKEGFTFAGWYSDKMLTKEYDFNTKITENITLYAKWSDSESDGGSDDEWINSFIDVSESDWFYDNVKYVFMNGLFEGTTDKTFSPRTPITRGMIVTVLGRMEGIITSDYMTQSFDDVALKQYYAPYVTWAKENDIILGITDLEFEPDTPLTREQLVAILWRYSKYKNYDVSIGEDTNILSYIDAQNISEYAISATQWACGDGVISGYTDGRLGPKDAAARAEVAAMLERFYKALAETN